MSQVSYLSQSPSVAISNAVGIGEASFSTDLFLAPSVVQLNDLCQDIFKDYMDAASTSNNILEMIQRYCDIAENTVEIGDRILKPADETCGTVLETFRFERNIYLLIKKLYESEQRASELSERSDECDSLLGRLYAKNNEFRTLVTLLDWSEEVAYKGAVDQIEQALSTQMEHAFADSAHRGRFAHLDSKFTEHLSHDDAKNIEHLKNLIFLFVRCGRISQALELVSKVGLSSLKPLLATRLLIRHTEQTPVDPYDENYGFAESLLHCKSMANMILSMGSPSIGAEDLRLWATIAGNIQALVKHVEHSDDVLWAYLNCAVERLLDVEVIDAHGLQEATVVDSLSLSGVAPTSLAVIFGTIVSAAPENVDFQILAHVAASNVRDLVNVIYSQVLEMPAEQRDENRLRFYTNLVLTLRLWYDTDDLRGSKTDVVIQAYVDVLMQRGLHSEVPFYVAQLSEGIRDSVMVELLAEQKTDDDRKPLLFAAGDAGFDKPRLCVNVFRKVVEDHPITFEDDNVDGEAIAAQLNSWSVLLYYPNETFFEAVVECNNLLRVLFHHGKLSESFELLSRSPTDLSSDINQVLTNPEVSERARRQLRDHQHEYDSYLVYLQIVDKNSHYRLQMAKRGEKLTRYTDAEYANLPRAQREEYDAAMVENERHIIQHMTVCEDLRRLLVDKISSLLKDVDSFFVTHLATSDVDNATLQQQREHELSVIHEVYLVKALEILIGVHQVAGKHSEVLHVADVISQHGLYSHLSKPSLRKILSSISKSGTALRA